MVDLPHPEAASGEALALVGLTIGGPDTAWHYRISVDGNMAMPPEPIATPTGEALVSLGAFRRHDLVTVEVLGAVVSREIDPADWLLGSELAVGLTVVSSRREPSPSGERGDVLGVRGDGVERLFAARWGHRLFVIRATAPMDAYPGSAEAIAGSIGSLDPVEAGGRYSEPVKKHGLDAPVPFRCLVPDTWRVDLGGVSEQGSSFQAVNLRNRVDDDGEVVGRLSVAVFTRGTVKKPREVAEPYFEALADGELRVLSDEFDAEPVKEPFDRSWLCVSPVTRPDSLPGEVRCRVLRHPAAWVLLAVLSPTAEDDRQAQMENKRALDIATSTLTIKSGDPT
jgi:hypothetical protein